MAKHPPDVMEKLKGFVLLRLKEDEPQRLAAIVAAVEGKPGTGIVVRDEGSSHVRREFGYNDVSDALQALQREGKVKQIRPRSGLWVKS